MYLRPEEFGIISGSTIVGMDGVADGSDRVIVSLSNGDQLHFYHHQDCCESVYLTDVDSDGKDLIGATIHTFAVEGNDCDNDYGVEQWTFYRLITSKGTLVLRWYGSSNGSYSTAVTVALNPEDEF